MENYKIKRVNEVKKWVDSIKDSRRDFEAAHVLEDELYLKILRGIAAVLCMKWLAILLTLIFAVAKVMGYFPWSWWLVFTPALAYVVLALILLIVLLIAALFYKDE